MSEDATWPKLTIPEALSDAIRRFGSDLVVYIEADTGHELTLASLSARSAELARLLISYGVSRTDRLAVAAPGCNFWPVVQTAAGLAGMLVTGINTAESREGIRRHLEQSRPRVAFVHESLPGHNDVLVQWQAESPEERRVVVISDDTGEFLRWIESSAPSGPDEFGTGTADDDFLLVFTSGTAGRPKGVVISQDAALRASHGGGVRMGITPADRLYSPFPFFHVAGAVSNGLLGLTVGASLVIPRKFDAAESLAAIERFGCTGQSGFEAMFVPQLESFRHRPRPIGRFDRGYALVAEPVMERLRNELGMKYLVRGYGGSECPGGTMVDWRDSWKKRALSVGKPLPGMSIEVRADDDTCVPPGVVGRIFLRGPCTMSRYWDDPGATSAALHDGWLTIGDVGYVDDEGFLYYLGRDSVDFYKSGGENVSTGDVEEVIRNFPDVLRVVVIGVPHPRFTTVGVAVVETRSGRVDEAAIIQYCKERLATFKVPKAVRHIEGSWPLSSSLKVQKLVLVAAFGDLFSPQAQPVRVR